jgi:hypothetical protein
MSGITHYTTAERLMSKIRHVGEHWMWTGAKSGSGYGVLSMPTPSGWQPRPAHRIAYELLVGSIPDGLTIDHLCRVRLCVNPAHLEPVTMRENILRGESPTAKNARKTTCDQGHPLRVRPAYPSTRMCRTCANIKQNERRVTPSEVPTIFEGTFG